MKIYVVQPGDSIWTISRSFGVTPDSIINANGLQDSSRLVIGQSLVIPGITTTYTVTAGDSLWSIAQKFNVSVESIQEANNNIQPEALYPDLVLRIPAKSKNYGYIQVNAFIQPSTAEKETNLMKETGPYLTYISPFSHHITADANLTPLNDEAIINAAKESRTAPLASITNISESGNFDTALMDKILNSDELQQTLINNILNLINTKGYYGTIVDIERITPTNRNKYNDFLRKLTSALHAQNKLTATALAPKTSDVLEGAWHGGHDYKAHGEIVDFVVVMTYEWGWSGGPPMAVAPLNEVRKVINYAVSVIPPKKIMMGIPLYGYDWTLPYTPGGEFAEAIGNQEAVDRAAKFGATIKYDTTAQSPNYSYIDSKGASHVVWFEDARSIEAKLKLVSEYDLRGVSYWVLSKPFPQNWQVLDDMFKIEKI